MRTSHLLISLPLAVFLILPQFAVSAGEEKAHVLIDFGDGTYVWEDVGLGTSRDAFNATLSATQQANLHLEYTWSAYGAFVYDIGDRNLSFPVWWHLLLWNRTERRWDESQFGASDLFLDEGDAIAWFLAIDGPSSTPSPSPTPPNPYPSQMPRGDLSNSGLYPGSLCAEYATGWEHDTGAFEISGTPAASNGKLFVPTWTGLSALDINTGRLVWKRDDINGMSSPAVLGDDLFIGAKDGMLRRISASTGLDIWNIRLVENPVFTGIASPPKPHLDKVYVGLFNETGGEGGVVALNYWSGGVLWRHRSPSVHMSSPSIRGSTLYVGVAGFFNNLSNSFTAPFGLLALDTSNGSMLWFFETSGSVMSSPMIMGSKVYFTSRDGLLHALWLNGTEDWSRMIQPSTSSPATDGDRIFVGGGVLSGEGSVAAFSQSGERLWNESLSGPVQTSPLYADGYLFVGTNEARGTFYALNASNGKVHWEFTPSPADYVLSSPIVADGALYMASDNGIVYKLACHRKGESWGPLAYGVIIAGALGTVAAVEIVLRARRRRGK